MNFLPSFACSRRDHPPQTPSGRLGAAATCQPSGQPPLPDLVGCSQGLRGLQFAGCFRKGPAIRSPSAAQATGVPGGGITAAAAVPATSAAGHGPLPEPLQPGLEPARRRPGGRSPRRRPCLLTPRLSPTHSLENAIGNRAGRCRTSQSTSLPGVQLASTRFRPAVRRRQAMKRPMLWRPCRWATTSLKT